MNDANRILRRQCANALRVLAMDAVQAANSGHPGMPMGMADIAEALWRHHLKHDPADPHWPDRDRFVLSNGHGSMLLYALLHLCGYDLPMDELRRFRQLHSRTPGHPEVDITPGVETTTGPLGQGLANAVGMALAEKLLAAEFNRPGHPVVDHRTWVFLGDGCLMEGISHEVCSLAGTWKLNKLVAFYDDNGISIDGDVAGWFTDDTPARFEAYGWTVVRNVDGHDAAALDAAIEAALRSERPVLVCCKTSIGYGSPNRAGSAKAHGEALGDAEIALTREALGWTAPPFEIPAALQSAWSARARGALAHRDWQQRFEHYAGAFPELAAELQRRLRRDAPPSSEALRALEAACDAAELRAATVATRKASQDVLHIVAPAMPELLGGSADLTGSNLTDWKGHRPLKGEGTGNHVHYGVREFGMSALMNGVALHGGYRPYGGTFLTFSDYSRNAIRMSALMHLPVVYVFTHDSIGLGEDGPTHQPVEHASSLRLIPDVDVWRPCDATETAVAWREALRRGATPRPGPSCLLLTRQALPHAGDGTARVDDIARGGYVLRRPRGERLCLIATGSEVGLALRAADLLAAEGLPARVVSMPCVEAFERQDARWKQDVIPRHLPRLAIEAGSTGLWWKYVGEPGVSGDVVGLDRFGESAPAGELFALFGLTAEALHERARALIDAVPAAGRDALSLHG
ncbi:transketolase [Methyloversatilis sp.]|uniref:transketolase n=1 Tax=Methyloversatilis sp. TaxID=2569862 RepID=UPI002734F642|nr:transketolase [Methyloversatilis sp.]MDP2869509.1 transketolase [Methyloversatilis sp.]MDP3456070.1 transketolase [Methyloversatilis sp.]MDP3577323.1 transketolase [Methyloversatilis sp.]